MAVPSDYAGLKFWIDASQLGGLSHGDPVPSWSDLSGNGHHISQSTAGNRPVYETNVLGALPAVHFDGSNDSLDTGSLTAVDLTGTFSIYAVVRFDVVAKGDTAQNTILSKDFTRYEFSEYQNRQAGYLDGVAVNSPGGGLAAGTTWLFEWHRRSDNWVVGHANGTTMLGGTFASSATGGSPLTIGARPGGAAALHLDGYVAEIAILPYLDDVDRHDLRSALGAKWGIGLPTYPLPLRPDAAKALLPSQPATILAPRSGLVTVRHYLGDTARPDFDRLWVQLPAAHAQEVTNGSAVSAWPGDEVSFSVAAGAEIQVAINGASGSAPGSAANAGPTFTNQGNNARVHEVDDFPSDVASWARYIEWEDLVIDGTNNFFNDSRTLIYYPPAGPTVGFIGFGAF